MFSVSFTTNGYLLNSCIINWLAQYECGFQITLDGGRESHNNTRFLKGGLGSYDRIVYNIRELIKRHLYVIVRINYTSKNIDSVRSILSSFKDLLTDHNEYLSFDFQRVWQERGNEEDDTERKISELRDLFFKTGGEVRSNYLLHDVRFPCYGDKFNYLLVNYNGDIFKCTARDFSSNNRVGILMRSGSIKYNRDVMEARRNSKFFKPICRKCRIAPLCGGGCTQKSYEGNDPSTCTLGFTDSDKDNAVIDILDWIITQKTI